MANHEGGDRNGPNLQQQAYEHTQHEEGVELPISPALGSAKDVQNHEQSASRFKGAVYLL